MQNRSESAANQFLAGQQKHYNKRLDRKNTVSNFSIFVLVFGAIGFMFTLAFFG